jgi:hypothetical protein
MRNACKTVIRKPEEERLCGDLDIHGRTILKCTLTKHALD